MKFVKARPFLVLAIITIAIGFAWHASGLKGNEGPWQHALYIAVYIIGFPFITAVQWLTHITGHPAIAGSLGLLIGLIPYLIADALLRRARSRPQR